MSPSSPLPARAVSAAARSPARRARRYQHDAKPKELERALDAVVEDCVADVGVDANAASESPRTLVDCRLEFDPEQKKLTLGHVSIDSSHLEQY